jgi:streptomycin 6-kinase
VRIELPPALIEFSTRVRGDDGRRWLARLPRLIETCERELDVSVTRALHGGSQNCVLACTGSRGEGFVLKIGFRRETIRREAAGLRAWTARVPRLVAYLPEHAAILLEEIVAGPDRPSRPSVAEAAATLRQLHDSGSTDVDVPTLVENQYDDLAHLQTPVATVAPLARELLASLAATSPPAVLLHGDYRASNLLYGGDGWTFVDPYPLLGEPAYDAARWILDAGTLAVEAVARQFAAAYGLDARRVVAWAWLARVRDAELEERARTA